MKAAKLEIGVLRQEAEGRRKEGRSQKKYFYKYEMLPVPLSEPRGLPKDMNPVYKEYFENNSVGIEHHFTWFMVQEVIEYDGGRRFLPCTGYVDRRYAYPFHNSGCFPQDLPKNKPVYKYKKDNTTEVSWVDTYRDYVGCVEWLIEELLKLGNPKKVRVILWLHY